METEKRLRATMDQTLLLVSTTVTSFWDQFGSLRDQLGSGLEEADHRFSRHFHSSYPREMSEALGRVGVSMFGALTNLRMSLEEAIEEFDYVLRHMPSSSSLLPPPPSSDDGDLLLEAPIPLTPVSIYQGEEWVTDMEGRGEW